MFNYYTALYVDAFVDNRTSRFVAVNSRTSTRARSKAIASNINSGRMLRSTGIVSVHDHSGTLYYNYTVFP